MQGHTLSASSDLPLFQRDAKLGNHVPEYVGQPIRNPEPGVLKPTCAGIRRPADSQSGARRAEAKNGF